MKRKIRNVLQAMGNGLQTEHAGEMMSTWRKLELLRNDNEQAPTSTRPDNIARKNNPVTFHIVPSLVEHK